MRTYKDVCNDFDVDSGDIISVSTDNGGNVQINLFADAANTMSAGTILLSNVSFNGETEINDLLAPSQIAIA